MLCVVDLITTVAYSGGGGRRLLGAVRVVTRGQNTESINIYSQKQPLSQRKFKKLFKFQISLGRRITNNPYADVVAGGHFVMCF